uniref:Pericentrin/AKAP-450 centrosomal targeting domain-containing protein n=1 Tax=Poecilia mexicana TaxID=48701 RepID=A0A3B3X1X2_9TELE
TVQDMEDALAAKNQALEELSRELEEMRSAFGADGVQQLQDFEAALKQRDGIITQLTSNLQQAREEKDEITKEFLALTEQSQKLQIQFQQLQAGEALRNTSHSSTAADLLQARQQLVQYQQQLEEMSAEVKGQQETSSKQVQLISHLQQKLSEVEDEKIIQDSDDKDTVIAEKERVISERDSDLIRLKDELENSEKHLHELRLQVALKDSELENCKGELANSRHRERMSSSEIMQLMGTVEDLQKLCHQGSMSESDKFQKTQEETARKLELLRAELDEMYGQQIVQMKQELNLQHAARMQQMTEQHQTEIELLKATYDETRWELSQVAQEKSKLQSKVESLVGDLNAARHHVEQVSTRLASQETSQQLQETIQALRDELSAAQEAAVEAETKHESEITNYKIKLEMLEREKDAVLDRMAESQEAELERLRTQLLFSHEEELTNLREDLQRESFLNAENLLNEAAVRHEKALDELRVGHTQQLDLLQKEKTSYAAERNDLLRKIHGLEEDLKLALQSSKTEELVLQLQELQVELKELRKGAQDRVRMQNQIQSLLKQTEVLENQKKEKEQKLQEHKEEKETLFQSNSALRDKIEMLTAQNDQFQQQVDELREDIEKQKSTFSFAEKNFEVNFQELKEEYASLAEAKTQLEERTLRETLEFEAKIARLQSDIRELEERSGNVKMERDLMEKLNVTLNEKKSQADRLSEVTERLMVTETRIRQLDEDLIKARQKNSEVIAKNESLLKELEKAQEIRSKQKKLLQKEEQTVEAVSPSEDHRLQIQSLQQEIKALTAQTRQSRKAGADARFWSGKLEAEEVLEFPQEMMDRLLLGAESQLESEEYFLGISRRLQAAVEKMLVTITDTTNQLEHARMTQTELMRESFRHNQEITELLQKQEELQERATEEARAREQLALELHRVTSSRLHELEQERLLMLEERELLSRQQDAMREEAGPRELYLLEETEKLMKEKVEVQRQAEKENTDLLKQVKQLEDELEEQVNKVIELEHSQTTETGDLRQQIQALEKQLEKNKKFLDEQAVDREHERDVFQQEIQKLEQQLKNPQKLQLGSEQRNQEVEQLSAQLKEKADCCSELLLGSEQLRRELGERDEEIEKLESRIRELEQALLASAESLEKVDSKKQHASITETKHSSLEAQLQTEREALERKEKEICNLEEQLEQFREELENKSEEVQQLHMQLEIQRKELSSQQQFLEVRDSLLQVSTVRNVTNIHTAEVFRPFNSVMEERDREIALLNEQISKHQHMETAFDNKVTKHDELIKELEFQVEYLRSEQDRLKTDREEEVDQLNAVIEKLQQELANIEPKQPEVEEELESGGRVATKEEFDEMKQRMDLATKELDSLRAEHSELLEMYLRLKQSAEASAEAENLGGAESELEEALREKTAGLVVLQAEVQALEQSAASRVEELELRIRELEALVEEKDSEVERCRVLMEETQSHADDLQQKVSALEGSLREKVAEALVSQATLEAFQQQQRTEASKREAHSRPAAAAHEFGDFGIPQMDFSSLGPARQAPRGKVAQLTQKLRDLEVGLSGMQEDQELQKQLLSSSEEEVQEYERRLAVLMELLSQMKAGPASESVPPSPQPPFSASSTSTAQPKRKGARQPAAKGASAKEKPSLSRKNSAPDKTPSPQPNSGSDQHRDTTTDSFTQTEPLQMSDLSQSAAKEQIEEVIGEFQDKIAQMQELHAAEILDMEARHISESENLRRDTQALEDECKSLKAVIDKLCSTEVSRGCEAQRFTTSDSSDYSQRTGFDVPSLQQEFRSTPEGARRETDDPLPDRIKTLLREVHQEGMQVLSLSELPLPEGEPGGQFSTDGWAKERDALLATVQSLKGLITQMQTLSQSQVQETSCGIADWRAQLLDAVRQVFMRERSVLKSALYSQLDRLDTSDAIVHLNQLERLLAEQVEAMGSLQAAERSSLLSEVQQLRGQLEQLHQSKSDNKHLSAGGTMEERRGRAADGAAEADGSILEEMKAELSQTKLELETTLKAQQKHLKELDTLRVEVSQKAAELDALNDELMKERKRSRDLQWAAEKERCRSGRDEDTKREELEDLQLALDEQKALADRLTQTLQQERQASSQTSQQAEQVGLGLQRHLQELQVQLETERAKAQEMSAALGRERELRAGGLSGVEGGGHDGRESGEESLLEKLQRELDDKHTQVVHLLSQVEAQRLEVVRKEEELTLANQKSRQDQDGLQEARAELDRLKVRMSEVKQQLEEEQQKRKSLEEEKERLEESGAPQAVWHGEPTDRTKDWVLQQKSGNAQSASANASPHTEGFPADPPGGPHHGPWRTVDQVVGKLHLVSSKIRSMASKTADRLDLCRSTAEVDGEELSWIQSSVDEVIGLLQQSPGLPFIPEVISCWCSSSSSNSLTERLLRQNAELTGFVSRLTEEKNDLRNHTLRLEEELRRYRQAGAGSPSRRGVSKADSAAMLLSQEREAWTREKLRLEKALHLSQSQVARLRGEIRSDALSSSPLSVLQRMYGKYLRSESFRKALIYQKKYLLLLLGGFQECEEATLSLLSKMGGRPSLSSLESFSQRRRGLSRFRSAVRVSIALSRMRFLVKRWHKATGMSSTVSCSISKNGTGQRNKPVKSCYRGAGGGGGVSSSRGRSGRESPRSGVSSSHHRFHTAGDHGALTCSHLQSYDPDRALTDYISRLEALQRRLGSVTSGNRHRASH